MKIFIFLVGIGWDWGILGSNNLMNWWDITPPFMYCVFHHISDHLQRLILFWQFYKKVGIRSDPPPLVGTKSQVCQRKYFCGSPEARMKRTTEKLQVSLRRLAALQDFKHRILTKTHCEVMDGSHSRSRSKLKVVKWGFKKWNQHILMYIYAKQCEILQKNRWKSSNGQNHCFCNGKSAPRC